MVLLDIRNLERVARKIRIYPARQFQNRSAHILVGTERGLVESFKDETRKSGLAVNEEMTKYRYAHGKKTKPQQFACNNSNISIYLFPLHLK